MSSGIFSELIWLLAFIKFVSYSCRHYVWKGKVRVKCLHTLDFDFTDLVRSRCHDQPDSPSLLTNRDGKTRAESVKRKRCWRYVVNSFFRGGCTLIYYVLPCLPTLVPHPPKVCYAISTVWPLISKISSFCNAYFVIAL